MVEISKFHEIFGIFEFFFIEKINILAEITKKDDLGNFRSSGVTWGHFINFYTIFRNFGAFLKKSQQWPQMTPSDLLEDKFNQLL